jgi:hypothetical protein
MSAQCRFFSARQVEIDVQKRRKKLRRPGRKRSNLRLARRKRPFGRLPESDKLCLQWNRPHAK